jgi:hypothetical protein
VCIHGGPKITYTLEGKGSTSHPHTHTHISICIYNNLKMTQKCLAHPQTHTGTHFQKEKGGELLEDSPTANTHTHTCTPHDGRKKRRVGVPVTAPDTPAGEAADGGGGGGSAGPPLAPTPNPQSEG